MKAPVREVVRVLELEGERGGQLRVLVLSCGCFHTRSVKARGMFLPKPPRSARCVACFVAGTVRGSVADMQKPSIGRIVMFKLGSADEPEICAAVITKVQNDTCVNVTIFRDGGVIEHRESALLGNHELPDSVGTWSWPARV